MGSAFYLTIVLFTVGLYGVLSRKNLLIVLMSLEIMFNSTLILLAASSSFHVNSDGIVFFFIIIAVAACEVAIGLSIAIAVYRKYKSVDISRMREFAE